MSSVALVRAEKDVEFSVFAIIREKLDESDNPNPYAAIDEVVRSIPSRHLRDAVRQLLPHAMRVEAARYSSSRDEATPARPHAEPKGQSSVSSPSRRSKYLPIHEKRISLTANGQGWRYLGKMTAEECEIAAAVRFRKAAETDSAAQQFARLAAKMRERGVAIVEQLSTIDFKSAWEGEE